MFAHLTAYTAIQRWWTGAAPYVALLRPQQWIKNMFVLLPMFFGGQLFSASALAPGIVATAAFVLASGAVYCLNDEVDREADARHPDKCSRPLASGAVSVNASRLMMAMCVSAALGLSLLVGMPQAWRLQLVVGAYLGLNMAYSLWLKDVPVVDVLIVAAGFVLRVVAGGVACGVWLSPWIVLMTFMLALFLAVAKRRHELWLLQYCGQPARRSVRALSLKVVDFLLWVQMVAINLLYVCYTLQPQVRQRYDSRCVWVTAIFVAAGMLRYMWLTVGVATANCPTRTLLRDRWLQLVIAAWLLTFGLIAY